jgi:hypothetical protein
MAGLTRKSFDTPDETRPFEAGMGKLEVIDTDDGVVGRATFEPGWRWSKHVKPIAGTESCRAANTGYFVSGRMRVVMDDGEEMEYGPADLATMAPGHDAWSLASSRASSSVGRVSATSPGADPNRHASVAPLGLRLGSVAAALAEDGEVEGGVV